MYAYPTTADLSPAILIDAYTILSSKEFTKKNAAILGKHFYVIQGVVQNELLGEPDSFGSTLEIKPSILDDNNFEKLEKECENIVILEKRFGGERDIVPPDAEMDPATILLLAKLTLELIKFLRERRK